MLCYVTCRQGHIKQCYDLSVSVCMAALDRKRCILWLHLQLRLQSCQIINDFDQIHCTLKPTQIETRPECWYQPHLLVANNKNNTAAFVWQLGYVSNRVLFRFNFSWCRLSTYACTITITVGIQVAVWLQIRMQFPVRLGT